MENSSMPSDAWNNVTTSSGSGGKGPSGTGVRQLTVKIVYLTIGSVGVLDNLFVIIVFALFIKITDKTMNILIMNQSIVDLCASVFILLGTAIEAKGTGLSRDNAWDRFVCRFWLTRRPLWCALVVSTYGILLMTLDRYIAVIYPIWYNQSMKVKRRLTRGAIVFIWIVMTAYQIIMAYTPTDIIDGKCVILGAFYSEAMEWSFGILKIVLTYLLPMGLMIFCYSRIVHILRTKVGDHGSSSINSAGRNAIVTSVMICCGFIVCWSPNQIFIFINNDQEMPVFANSCINPLIYAAKYREFQHGLRRLVLKLKHDTTQVSPNNA